MNFLTERYSQTSMGIYKLANYPWKLLRIILFDYCYGKSSFYNVLPNTAVALSDANTTTVAMVTEWVLCGKCPSGMSESLFNTKCKLNNDCTSVTFWPAISVYLILYLLFFLYQEDILSFAQTRIINRAISSSTSKLRTRWLA